MSDKSKSYFTIGEFAQLFEISKQTLFYYEKNNIFAPKLIEDNGYRYYSLDQYFVFEIIITLRKLGVSLKEISTYVTNRNIDSLQQLFADKLLEYDVQLELLQRNRNNLRVHLERLQQAKEIRCNRITLENCEEEYFVADDFSALQGSMKEQVKLIARHNLPFAKNEIFNEYHMGYILPQEDLLAENYLAITRIFTRISYPGEYAKALIKPKGLYAKIATPDGYHANYKSAIKKLFDFIKLNELEIIGDAYICQLRNYWATANPDEYVTQIAIQVDYNN
ncbi:Multidrug-efflux transporter 1 regulator [Sporomusa ovata DSM 2662]|uniref:MerR family transcriptional regulator n=1 Tax=Sporomusa ovata TaxID=2378 RepID=UPI0030CF6A0A